MTRAQKELIWESLRRMTRIADFTAALFYARLFNLDHSMRRVFNGDMVEQRKQLAAVIRRAAGNIDRIETVLPEIRRIGSRYARRGIRDEHFDTVCSALMWSLERSLGKAFTAQTRMAWMELYNLLTSNLQLGAADAFTCA